jgi:Protein of unknown function (DUF1302)
MSTKLQRAGLLSSVAAITLLSAMNAQAVETKFGDVDIVFDTTVSFGASMRTADREDQFLSESNGGPVDPREAGLVAFGGAFNGPRTSLCSSAAACSGLGVGILGAQFLTANPDNFDGSVNADDARLNFDGGDLLGATFKANHDLQMTWRNYKLFARAIGFYDVILADEGAGDRSQVTDDAIGDVGRNYELLDLFVSADYTIADLPVNLRLGKQVINWGESTFILNGNNVFNPIDVAAFRRPGSEIKEALVPLNAFSGSVSLPFDVSLSGYYALNWEPFELDPSGTAFSTSDVVAAGTGLNGNINRISFLSGSPLSGERRNCSAAAGTATRTVQSAYNAAIPGTGLLDDPTLSGNAGKLECSDNALVNYTINTALGFHERDKLSLISAATGSTLESQGVIERSRDHAPDETGDFGVSAKYFADWLDGTEFGFYYQNYSSRLPFVSEHIGIATAGYATIGDSFQGTTGGIGGRTLLPSGCGYGGAGGGGVTSPGVAGATAAGTLGAVNGIVAAFTGTNLGTTNILDPHNMLNASVSTALGNIHPGLTLAATGTGADPYDTVANLQKLNCALAFFQSERATSAGLGAGATTPLLMNGAETVTLSSNIDLFLEYPDDIDVWGFSFNATLFGWGVQGDFTFRPEAPFQVDTDSLTIAAAAKSCAFEVGAPAALDAAAAGSTTAPLRLLFTPDGSGVNPRCGDGDTANGVLRNEMYTAQIGTTATFTGSDWWVDAIGADLGILVTEAGMVYVPGVEDTWIDNNPASTFSALSPFAPINNPRATQYQNIGCQGSDLPLGGLLGLDRKSSKACRPNDFSAGVVMLARVEYNNFMDTGFTVAPQLVYSYDFEGTTPSPYGNYLEDRQTIGFSVTGTLNNNFRIGASYSNFFGGHIANKAKDTDFASLTASYTF